MFFLRELKTHTKAKEHIWKPATKYLYGVLVNEKELYYVITHGKILFVYTESMRLFLDTWYILKISLVIF